MPSGLLEGVAGRRILMLQGPVGPFFAALSHDMAQRGASVYKVNFNGGDWFDALGGQFSKVVNFRGSADAWPGAFEALIAAGRIDTVLLFGDCRPVHAAILPIAREAGLAVKVFEEGYLRPDYITVEPGGVNARSSMTKDTSVYRAYHAMTPMPLLSLGSTFVSTASKAMRYHIAASAAKPFFKRYVHHRPLGIADGARWLAAFWRREIHARQEAWVMPWVRQNDAPPFFLVVLQVPHDAQVVFHSSFSGIEEFIWQTLESFASFAPADAVLLVKHHPLGRAYADYTDLINKRASELGIAHRCHAIHDQHLPSLLERSRGVVLINSTVGLSALDHGKPVKVCGLAIYDLPGLTFQGPLDDFWSASQGFAPDMTLLRGFRNYLLQHNQYNGSYYKAMPHTGYVSGVNWTKRATEPLDLTPTVVQENSLQTKLSR